MQVSVTRAHADKPAASIFVRGNLILTSVGSVVLVTQETDSVFSDSFEGTMLFAHPTTADKVGKQSLNYSKRGAKLYTGRLSLENN